MEILACALRKSTDVHAMFFHDSRHLAEWAGVLSRGQTYFETLLCKPHATTSPESHIMVGKCMLRTTDMDKVQGTRQNKRGTGISLQCCSMTTARNS